MRRIALAVSAILCVSPSAGVAQRGEVAPTWTLVEELRIGGGDTGPTSFNDIRGIVATKTGNVFVLDFKTREIRVFDANGKFLRLAARDGAGPGEIRNANGLAIGKDDVVWVNDPMNGRFSQYRPDGQFLRQIVVPMHGYGYIWKGVLDDRGRVVDDLALSLPTGKTDAQTGFPVTESRLRLVHADGRIDTVSSPTCPSGPPLPNPAVLNFTAKDGRGGNRVMSIPFLPSQWIALTRSGTVWCTSTAEYRLSVGPVGGALKEVVHLKVPSIPVPAEERKRQLDIIDSIARNYGPLVRGDPSSIPRVKPQIQAIHADDLGRVWVRQTDTPLAAPIHDVFDATGRMVARVRAPGKVGTRQLFITGNHLYTVITDDDDVPVVVRYRIVR
jgi:hypothetical protein